MTHGRRPLLFRLTVDLVGLAERSGFDAALAVRDGAFDGAARRFIGFFARTPIPSSVTSCRDPDAAKRLPAIASDDASCNSHRTAGLTALQEGGVRAREKPTTQFRHPTAK
jgi:hypothetical protein